MNHQRKRRRQPGPLARRVFEQTLPSFQKTALPGGVRVVTETIPSVRSVSVGLWIHTGSRDETPEESGISHFIEHMVFKGTRRRRMHQIARRLESVGGYLNAFTGKEYTCFFARALDEHLARSIDTLADLVLEPSFPEKELEREKDVVLEEIKMYEDTPEDVIFDLFEETIYKGHALGRPILGFPETVRSFSRAQLQAYVDAHYTPERVVVAVAGNVVHEDVVELVAEAVAATERPPGPLPKRAAHAYAPHEVTVRRPIQQAHFVLGTRTFGVHDERRSALSVLNTLLGGGMSSRLNQHVREKYGYCYNIYSFLNLHTDTGDFGVYMGTDAAKVERARKLVIRELEKLADKPVSTRALNQAKNQVRGSIMLGLESMSNRMMRIGRQELYFGRYFSLDEITADLDRVTPEAVQEVARALFVPEALSTAVLAPDGRG